MPSMPGICRSSRINAGCRCDNCSRKLAALSAVMTVQPTPLPICSISSRKSASSSTASNKFLSRRNTLVLLFSIQQGTNASRQLFQLIRLGQQLDGAVEQAPVHQAAIAEARCEQHLQL